MRSVDERNAVSRAAARGYLKAIQCSCILNRKSIRPEYCHQDVSYSRGGLINILPCDKISLRSIYS